MFIFDVSPDHGDQFRVVATSRDVSHWERTGVAGQRRSLSMVEKDMRMSYLEELAWVAANRVGEFPGTLDDFREQCDIEIVPGEDADPTQPGR